MSQVQLSSNVVNIIKTKNGIDGQDGLNQATIFLYQRAASQPSVPQSNLTYTFSTGLITGNIGNWSQSMPTKNSNPCWVTTAIAISKIDEDTIYSSDWKQSEKLAEDGVDGKDGADASQYTIHTNAQEILKFIITQPTSGKYEFSLDELRFNAYSIKDQIAVSNIQIANQVCKYADLDISIVNYKLKETIKENAYSRYIEIKQDDDIFFYFKLGVLYQDSLGSTLLNNLNDSFTAIEKTEIVKNIQEFFNTDLASVDVFVYGQVIEQNFIEANIDEVTFNSNKTLFYTKTVQNNVAIYTQCTSQSVFSSSTDYYAEKITEYNVEKYISIKNGLSSEMLAFSVNAGSINTAIQNTKLKFNTNGLTITNGGIKIYTGDEVEGEEVFRIEASSENENEKRLFLKGSGVFTGTVYAQNGEFTGTVHAQNGEFNGTINAGSGSIGGFTIDNDSIYAGNDKQNSPLLLQSSNGSLINVDNIQIGTGAKIKDYLQLGNLKLQNPELYSNVMELKVANQDYFILTNDGNILGKNWSITKDANGFVTANFGNIIAQDGIFSGEITASIINATTINTVNFVTEKARSMGGAFIFKPTFKINNIEKKGNNIVEFELELSEEERKYFNLNLEEEIKANIVKKEQFYIDDNGQDLATENTDIIEWIPVLPNETCRFSCIPGNTLRRIRIHEYSDISEFQEGTPSFNTWVRQAKNIATANQTPNEEYTVSWTTSATTKYLRISIGVEYSSPKVFQKQYIVGVSDDSVHFGYITDVSDRNNNKISVKFFNTDYNNIDNVNSLTLFGRPYNDSLIGINSDSNSVGDILPPRALVMEDFTLLQNSDNEIGDLNYIPKLILGDLSSLMAKNIPGLENIGGYGLYADNVFLRGSLTTSGGNNNYAGVNTQGPISFNYNSWSTNGATTTSSNQYSNDKIIFWGGAGGVQSSDIQTSPFIVTDKGNVFARSGEFKGSVISDSLITNTIIKAPVIYGNNSQRQGHENEPSLKIYNTDTSTGGIGFYKQVGQVDEERSGVDQNDILTLSISTNGFTHFNNEFISFNENNGNIIFTGTKYIVNNTELRDKELVNEASGIYFNQTDDSKLKLDYNSSRGIEITKDQIINYGGYTVNEGIVEIKTIVQSNTTKTLKYYVNSENYYCLMVS